jgi:hypothetical protein
MTTFLLISCVPICGAVYVNSNDESGSDFDTNKKNALPSKSQKSNFLNYKGKKQFFISQKYVLLKNQSLVRFLESYDQEI